MKLGNDSLVCILSILAVLVIVPVLAPEDEANETEPDIDIQESTEDAEELGATTTTTAEEPITETKQEEEEEEEEEEERDISDVFEPSEAISEDYAVPFPVDI